MKKLFVGICALFALHANAQFIPGQVLKSSDLNAAIAAPTITGGSITGAPINNAPIGQVTPAAGSFTTLSATNATITGGSINNAPIGQTTPAAGNFTSLSATGGLSASTSVAGAGGWGIAGTFSDANYPMIRFAATTPGKWSSIGNNADGGLQFYVNGANGAVGNLAASLDASGNFGLGVTPSAIWSSGRGIQINTGATIMGDLANMYQSANSYYDGTNWKYLTGSAASRYDMAGGAHTWYTAPSGTAGDPITWNQAMTLDNNSNLLLGTSNAVQKLTVFAPISANDAADAGIAIVRAGTTYGTNLYHTFSTAVGGTEAFGISVNNNTALTDPLYTKYLAGSNGVHIWYGATTAQEDGRFDASGNFLVGVTSGSFHTIRKASAPDVGNEVLEIDSNGGAIAGFYATGSWGVNAANASVKVGKDTTTGRSINAGGTINASGADYAEYMRKAAGAGELKPGQIVGVDSDGNLTDRYSAAVSFLIVSTDPSYIGGDTWGSEKALGMAHPTQPASDASAAERAKYLTDKAKFDALLALAQSRVAIVAYAGQVPVNVKGGKPGQYVIPVRGKGDTITGCFVDAAAMTFGQYRAAVGIVQNILSDGRANVRVKVL